MSQVWQQSCTWRHWGGWLLQDPENIPGRIHLNRLLIYPLTRLEEIFMIFMSGVRNIYIYLVALGHENASPNKKQSLHTLSNWQTEVLWIQQNILMRTLVKISSNHLTSFMTATALVNLTFHQATLSTYGPLAASRNKVSLVTMWPNDTKCGQWKTIPDLTTHH